LFRPVTQPIDPVSTVAKREPAAGSANAWQVVAADRGPNPIEDVSPRKPLTSGEPKQSDHLPVLCAHLGFRILPVQGAADRLPVGASGTDDIRAVEHFHQLIRMFGETTVNGAEVGDKLRTVAFAPEALQTEDRVAPQTDNGDGGVG
jgi:hypothetical protein